MFLTTTARLGLYIALLTVLLAAGLLFLARGEDARVVADGGTEVPASPSGLQVSTTPGSLDVSVDWDDTVGATHYKVFWRLYGPNNPLNAGVEAQSSEASITVADYGEWVVRVQACNSAGCAPGKSRRFAVSPVPTPTPTPTVTPTPAIRIPVSPTGLRVSTTPGSLDASVDWDDTSGSTHYKVYRRLPGPGNPLNEGVEAQSSEASITVAGYGEWVVRVEACNSAGCGPGKSRRFAVSPVPTTTPTPTVTPTLTIRTPAAPTGLRVAATTGSLDASVDWDDTSGAGYYKVYWRVAGFGNSLNEGIEAQSSDASITVADYGEWVARVQSCNSAGCSLGSSRRFAVAPAPTATPTPAATATATPTPDGRGYRGQLGEVLVELSLLRSTQAATSGGQSATRTTPRIRPECDSYDHQHSLCGGRLGVDGRRLPGSAGRTRSCAR